MLLNLPIIKILTRFLYLFLCLSAGQTLLRAQDIAVLMEDGRVIAAEADNVRRTTETLARFESANGTFVDVTFGDGYIYGLRSDSAVFRADLNGNVKEVQTTGWAGVTKIDFANGELFGLVQRQLPLIYDAKGRERLLISKPIKRPPVDFGVREDGTIMLLIEPDRGTWSYTFADGYEGPLSGFIENGFQTWGARPLPLDLDVSGTMATVLRKDDVDGAIWWQFQDQLEAEPVMALRDMPQVSRVSLSPELSTAFFLETQNAGVYSAPVYSGSVPNYLGSLAEGTGVGIVVLDD